MGSRPERGNALLAMTEWKLNQKEDAENQHPLLFMSLRVTDFVLW
jgi:hypothetical protein